MLVYVLNKHGKSLMPCKASKARRLLRDGKATVKDVEPFTIQLLYGSSGYKQPITLGMDTGYKYVGLSAISGNKEIYRSEVELRTNISNLLTTRRIFRRSRRGRKTRYRKPRFMNRSSATRKGRLPPSVQHKVDTHIRLVERIKKILPVSKTIIEMAKFDIQRINNPNIKGKEYQHGEQYEYDNVKCYIRDRDGFKCRHCGDRKSWLQVHHILHRNKGGADIPSNLVTLCKPCHDAHHRGELEFKFKKPPIQKQMTVMNIISKRLSKLYSTTFGYITKMKRLEMGLEKSHVNDAFVIAGGTENVRRLDCIIIQKQIRRNNRKLHRGYRSEIPNQCPKEIFGFGLFDRVIYEDKKFFVWGRRKRGHFLLKTLEGKRLELNHKKLRKIKGHDSFLTEIHSWSDVHGEE